MVKESRARDKGAKVDGGGAASQRPLPLRGRPDHHALLPVMTGGEDTASRQSRGQRPRDRHQHHDRRAHEGPRPQHPHRGFPLHRLGRNWHDQMMNSMAPPFRLGVVVRARFQRSHPRHPARSRCSFHARARRRGGRLICAAQERSRLHDPGANHRLHLSRPVPETLRPQDRALLSLISLSP